MLKIAGGLVVLAAIRFSPYLRVLYNWRSERRRLSKNHDSKVAVVTGANKGIGKEIVRRLSELLGDSSTIVLTSRSPTLGNQAVDDLKQSASLKSANIVFHQLDIEKENSIKELSEFLHSQYGKIDILVNNAGFAYKSMDNTPFSKQARDTIDINYKGTLNVITELLPLVNTGGRIINIASIVGKISKISSVNLKNQLLDPNLTVDRLSQLMEQFVTLAQTGEHKVGGWPTSAYSMSKIGVIQLSRVLSRDYPNISVISCCPGFCHTDMTVSKSWLYFFGSLIMGRSAWEGADTPAWLAAVLSDKEIGRYNGKFVYTRSVKNNY